MSCQDIRVLLIWHDRMMVSENSNALYQNVIKVKVLFSRRISFANLRKNKTSAKFSLLPVYVYPLPELSHNSPRVVCFSQYRFSLIFAMSIFVTDQCYYESYNSKYSNTEKSTLFESVSENVCKTRCLTYTSSSSGKPCWAFNYRIELSKCRMLVTLDPFESEGNQVASIFHRLYIKRCVRGKTIYSRKFC